MATSIWLAAPLGGRPGFFFWGILCGEGGITTCGWGSRFASGDFTVRLESDWLLAFSGVLGFAIDLGVDCFVARGGLGGPALFVVDCRRCWGWGCEGGEIVKGTD